MKSTKHEQAPRCVPGRAYHRWSFYAGGFSERGGIFEIDTCLECGVARIRVRFAPRGRCHGWRYRPRTV